LFAFINVFKLATGCINVPFLHLIFLLIGIRVSLKSLPTIGIPVPCSFKNILTLKINNSILQEVEYQLLINNMIDTYIYDKVNNNVDCRLLWDVLKIEIREATIIYCKSK
jgi:hypothetical protein